MQIRAKEWAIRFPRRKSELTWESQGFKNVAGSVFTLGDYNRLFQIQGGHCKICGIHQIEIKRAALHVDHDHKTGIVRGLLCFNCNKKLGVVETFADQATKYLGEFHAS